MSENILPLITNKQIDQGSKKLDELIDFTKIIKNKALAAGVELIDGKAFKLSLNGLNDFVSKYIPDKFKDEFQTALDDVFDGDKDFTIAADNFFSVANQLIENLKDKNIKPYIVSSVNVIIEMMSTFVHILLEDLAEKE